MTPAQAISLAVSAANAVPIDHRENAVRIVLVGWVNQQPDVQWACNELNKWALLMSDETARDMVFRTAWSIIKATRGAA